MRTVLAAGLLLLGCGRPPQRLVVAYPTGPATVVPFASNEEFTTSILFNIYEPLVELDGELALRPGLAESWHTPESTVWVFRLRPGVRFHDGSALDAAHVAQSLRRAQRDPDSKRQTELAVITSIEAPDEHTVVLRTATPIGPLLNRLAQVLIWKSGAEPELPLGTGPYRVRSWSPGGDTRLEAVPTHHGGAPAIRELEFRVVPDERERLRLLSERQVHVLVDVPPERMPELAARPTLRTAARRGLRVLFLGMDTRNPPFSDRRVRQAVALALDRAALVGGPLGGHAAVVDQLVAPEVSGHHDRLPSRGYDPEEARRLMAAAGRGAGFDVDLEFMPGKYRAIEAVVGAIAADLQRIGIRARPRHWEPSAFMSRVERRQMRLYVLGWLSNSGDAGITYDYLLHTPGGGFGQDNGGGYSNAELDRLLRESSLIVQPGGRWPLLKSVAELVHADVPVVPLYRQTDLYAVARDLAFTPRLDRRLRAVQMRWER